MNAREYRYHAQQEAQKAAALRAVEDAAMLSTFDGRRSDVICRIAYQMASGSAGLSPWNADDLTTAWETYRYHMNQNGFPVDPSFEAFSTFTDDLTTEYRDHTAA